MTTPTTNTPAITMVELRAKAQSEGYVIKVEDRNNTDATPVYAIYRSYAAERPSTRKGTIAAAYAWLSGDA